MVFRRRSGSSAAFLVAEIARPSLGSAAARTAELRAGLRGLCCAAASPGTGGEVGEQAPWSTDPPS